MPASYEFPIAPLPSCKVPAVAGMTYDPYDYIADGQVMEHTICGGITVTGNAASGIACEVVSRSVRHPVCVPGTN